MKSFHFKKVQIFFIKAKLHWSVWGRSVWRHEGRKNFLCTVGHGFDFHFFNSFLKERINGLLHYSLKNLQKSTLGCFQINVAFSLFCSTSLVVVDGFEWLLSIGTVHQPSSAGVNKNPKNYFSTLGKLGIEHSPAGRGAWTLPLCYDDPFISKSTFAFDVLGWPLKPDS